MGTHQIAARLRASAKILRRLATEIEDDPAAAATLRQIADTLKAAADGLERKMVQIKPPLNDA
jgi:hypothetical protein